MTTMTAQSLNDLTRRRVSITFEGDVTVWFEYRPGRCGPALTQRYQELVSAKQTHEANVFVLTELLSAWALEEPLTPAAIATFGTAVSSVICNALFQDIAAFFAAIAATIGTPVALPVSA